MTNHPRPALDLATPDEVAECWHGVSDDLYHALWRAAAHMAPISDQIDIEESSPCDAIGLNTVASVWSEFTPTQQAQLNELADSNA